MLEQLKNFDANRLNIHELIALAAYGRMLRAEYDRHQVDEPDWLPVQLKSLDREIRTRNQDNIEKQLREKRAKLDQLKTPQERRRELRQEINQLEKEHPDLVGA